MVYSKQFVALQSVQKLDHKKLLLFSTYLALCRVFVVVFTITVYYIVVVDPDKRFVGQMEGQARHIGNDVAPCVFYVCFISVRKTFPNTFHNLYLFLVSYNDIGKMTTDNVVGIGTGLMFSV